MANFLKDIEKVLGDNEVEAIVIGHFGGYGTDDRDQLSSNRNKIQKWNDVKQYMDYEYDDSWGGQDCHSVFIWTKDRIYFVGTYDGSTWITSVPRNPEDCSPHSVGGG